MNDSKNLVSLVMAVRNERGGLEAAVRELERLASYKLEMIFVEGGSSDGTYEELLRLSGLPHIHQMTVLKQDGVGKKDAVVKGLKSAKGELVFVFDNDGEISASELPAFIETLKSDRNLFLNGNRFVLPMEKHMQLLNRLGGKAFAVIMSVMTGTRLYDSLCGIKGASAENYRKMIANGVFENDLDKFAEFDQLFGAKRLGLRIKELPVVYRNRRYGESKVRRFSVGWQLLKRIASEIFYRIANFARDKFLRTRNIESVDESGVGKTRFARFKRLDYILFAFALLVIAGLSSRNFLTYPKIWQDESSTIEQAYTFMRYGTPDIEVAPKQFTGVPYLIQSTGYPVEVSLAMVFKIFGYGFFQARMFMFVWTISALVFLFFLARKLFGRLSGFLAFILIASFSSFYNSGRAVVGEIPGFVFLLSGLACFINKKYISAGLLLGFAVVTKPSVFGILIPTVFITLLLHRVDFFKKLAKVAMGMIPPAVLWFVFVNQGVVSVDVLKDIARTYANPFGMSQAHNFISNLTGILHSSTLLYFGALFIVLLLARVFSDRSKVYIVYDFVLSYSVLAFVYYLRSPGWLRYILIAELLILFLLPDAVLSLSRRFFGGSRAGSVGYRVFGAGCIMALVFIQLFRFAYGANIFYSDAIIKTADYINEKFPDDSVAVINSLPLAVLLNQTEKYKVITNGFVVPYGAPSTAVLDPKPFSVRPLVGVFVIPGDPHLRPEDQKVLSDNYRFVDKINGYNIYRRSK